MLSASLEDAIIYEIKLNSSSFSIHNEEDVISFDYLVVPETMLNELLSTHDHQISLFYLQED